MKKSLYITICVLGMIFDWNWYAWDAFWFEKWFMENRWLVVTMKRNMFLMKPFYSRNFFFMPQTSNKSTDPWRDAQIEHFWGLWQNFCFSTQHNNVLYHVIKGKNQKVLCMHVLMLWGLPSDLTAFVNGNILFEIKYPAIICPKTFRILCCFVGSVALSLRRQSFSLMKSLMMRWCCVPIIFAEHTICVRWYQSPILCLLICIWKRPATRYENNKTWTRITSWTLEFFWP